jgi:hypothetical protein
MDQPRDENCCLPGDITVTPIPEGYIIGRALEQIGSGPWWQYIATTRDFQVAVNLAKELADSASVRAWMHDAADKYTPIPLRPPEDAA